MVCAAAPGVTPDINVILITLEVLQRLSDLKARGKLVMPQWMVHVFYIPIGYENISIGFCIFYISIAHDGQPAK